MRSLAFSILVAGRKDRDGKGLCMECPYISGGEMSFLLSLMVSDVQVVCIDSMWRLCWGFLL